ncbi:HPF/RaiA family ribosome-associated protein [Celeribacter halophilus]|nr:HPF/RaiA family ribosome-associated protein [Celeribacter halophilus]
MKDIKMRIEVSTANSINGSEALTSQIKGLIQHELTNLEEHITRIEVHVSDANADKSGPDDMKCSLEARLKGQQPIVVTDTATTIEQATKGAAGKMKSSLERTLGRQSDRR